LRQRAGANANKVGRLANEEFQVDLSNCEREPIHQLGAIQPFGFLIALSPDWLVARASENVDAFFGVSANDMLGTPAVDHLGEGVIHTLRNRMAMLRGDDAVERIFGVAVPGTGRRFDFAIHAVGPIIVIEGEPSADVPAADPTGMIRAMMARLDTASDLPGFYREGARQIRAITGFDRVMVYRFDGDGSGVVVAEATRPGIGSFLDLRYPASDIPAQARRLYLRTPFRIIGDITAEAVAILPQRDERGEPLDLSLSTLRAVSPIHIEYLHNMGVGASLSISIIVEGRLWGLFACHHYGARIPDFEQRSIAELFGAMFAFKLEARERKTLAAYETRARAVADRLLAAVAGDASLLDRPDWLGEMLSQTVACDGIGIWVDGKVATSGITPPAAAIPQIVRRLNAMASGRVYATDHLAEVLPQAADYAEAAAGLLAIPISRTPRDYVLLFRQEKRRSVTWGGDPHKPATWGPNGMRLSPRQSFEAWTQEVHGRSEPFLDAEQRVAEMLRASLIEIVLRLSDDAQEERRRASERQELLIAELNHRVRNILSLIRGLVRQSARPGDTMSDYIAMLDGRIQSLARAHDQITQDNWSPAPLHRLIETEASAYLAGKAARVSTDGPAILLQPHAFSTLALVFHELMTNSAKYGALSDSGAVSVSWRQDEVGDLYIDWRERGGPAVRAPTRQGFGTTIIQRSIPYDLGGKAEVRYVMTGLEADFCIPAKHVVAASPTPAGTVEPAPLAVPVRAAEKLIDGPVLLVEDSLIIAMDAEDILAGYGASRVTTAASVAAALEEIDRQDFALAVLDVNLGTETSLPIAEALKAHGIRFVFATGYGEQLKLPATLADVPVLQKPYTTANLGQAVARLLGK
jgi:light-regulated signal transduction histidine kinase (bacteriophytochrome)/CheY-like chemotaxis protein